MIKRFFDWLDGLSPEGMTVTKLPPADYLEPDDTIMTSRRTPEGYVILGISARNFAASITVDFDYVEKQKHSYFSVGDMSDMAAKVLANHGKFKIKGDDDETDRQD